MKLAHAQLSSTQLSMNVKLLMKITKAKINEMCRLKKLIFILLINVKHLKAGCISSSVKLSIGHFQSIKTDVLLNFLKTTNTI